MTTVAAAFAVVLGALGWTLLEYVMHRWLGHDRRFRGNAFGVEHTRHHAVGNYFASAWLKLVLGVVVSASLMAAGSAVAGRALATAFVGGLMGMYGAYELSHWLLHVHPGLGPYGRWARLHHFHHHFVDPRVNHGVTTPLWDVVFGTRSAPRETIVVPRKLAMRWLVDPATGEVVEAWRARFVLGGR